MLHVNIVDISYAVVNNIDFHCIYHGISKSEAINLLKSSVLGNHGYV